MRGCLRRSGPDNLARRNFEPRVARMSRAIWARSPQATTVLRPELRGCLRRNRPDHLARGISEPGVARMSQANRAGPAQVRVYLSPRATSCSPETSQAKFAGPLRTRLLGAKSCEDVSGEFGWTTSRLASRISELRECPGRPGPDHLRSGHIWAQSCEDVQGESDQLRSEHFRSQRCEDASGDNGPDHLAKGISEPRVARMSQAKWGGPHQARTYMSPELQGSSGEPGRTSSRAASKCPELRRCLRLNWPDHRARSISQSWEDVSGENV